MTILPQLPRKQQASKWQIRALTRHRRRRAHLNGATGSTRGVLRRFTAPNRVRATLVPDQKTSIFPPRGSRGRTFHGGQITDTLILPREHAVRLLGHNKKINQQEQLKLFIVWAFDKRKTVCSDIVSHVARARLRPTHPRRQSTSQTDFVCRSLLEWRSLNAAARLNLISMDLFV